MTEVPRWIPHEIKIWAGEASYFLAISAYYGNKKNEKTMLHTKMNVQVLFFSRDYDGSKYKSYLTTVSFFINGESVEPKGE